MTVRAILDRKGVAVRSVPSHTPVREVLKHLDQQAIGALVITDDGDSILGIVSERDVIRGLRQTGDGVLDAEVEDIMTRNVITCDIGDKAAEVTAQMINHHIRHIPVIADGKLAGVISIRDILKRRLDEIEAEASAMLEYIQA